MIKNLNKNKAFLSLTIICFIFSIILFLSQTQKGLMGPDSFQYLTYGLYMSGMESLTPVMNPYLPPFISFLISLFFKINIIETWVIMLISTIFFFFSVLGFYLLFTLRFSKKNSFIFSTLFMFTPIVFSWGPRGNVDIPLLCFIIWSIYILIYGFERNDSALYLLFPLLAMGFLTKYVFGLILLPISFYFIMKIAENKLNIKKIKKLIISLFLGIMILIPYFCISMTLFGKYLPFLSQVNEVTISTNIQSPEKYGFNSSRIFYIKNIAHILTTSNDLKYAVNISANAYYIFIISALIGLIGYIWTIIKKTCENINFTLKIKYLSFIIVFLLLLLLIYLKSSIIPILILNYILFLLGYVIIRNTNIKFINIDITMALLGMSFLIFFSIHDIKSLRYIIPAITSLFYFMLIGIEKLYLMGKKIVLNLNWNNKSLKKDKAKYLYKYKALCGIFLILIMFFAIVPSSIESMNFGKYNSFESNVEGELVNKWFMKNVKSPKDEVIYSNIQGVYTWYLKSPIYYINDYSTKNPKIDSKNLLEKNVTYYIYNGKYPLKIPGYERVLLKKNIAIYVKI